MTVSASSPQSSQGGGHRTLLYGHAILLKHTHSSMVSTPVPKCPQGSSSPHSLLFYLIFIPVFLRRSTWAVWPLRDHWPISWLLMWACRRTPQVVLHFISHYLPTHASCHFWMLNLVVHHRRGLLVDHPSSLQAKVWRREGQGGGWPHSCQRFFRAILGNFDFSYLHLSCQFVVHESYQCYHLPSYQHLSYASGDLMVDASFMQTLWTMTPVMSGCELAEGRWFFFSLKTEFCFVHKTL